MFTQGNARKDVESIPDTISFDNLLLADPDVLRDICQSVQSIPGTGKDDVDGTSAFLGRVRATAIIPKRKSETTLRECRFCYIEMYTYAHTHVTCCKLI